MYLYGSDYYDRYKFLQQYCRRAFVMEIIGIGLQIVFQVDGSRHIGF